MVIAPGHYTNTELSNEAYHADPAIGSSAIKTFKDWCPAMYYARYVAPEPIPYEGSSAQRFGSHAHIKLLEPEKFNETYVVSPEFAELKSGENKGQLVPMNESHADYKAFVKKNPGKEAILYSTFKAVEGMAAQIASHPLASRMLVGGVEEMSFFAKDEETGLMLKARPDYLVKLDDYGVVLVDYKTTALSLGTKKQSNHAFDLGRQIQAAHHKRVAEMATGGQINEVVYITQMQQPPYLIRIFRMPEEAIAIGNDMCRTYLDGIKYCYDTGEWPGYPPEIEDYIVPMWLSNDFN